MDTNNTEMVDEQATDLVEEAPAEVDAQVEQQDNSEELPNSEDSFPRHVVEKLRKESAGYRDRAKTAEERADILAQRLHTALVAADGRLADPEDLAYSEEHLEDPDALKAAVDDLITRKPGLRSRKVAGDIGQGARGAAKAEEVDLISIINRL